MSVNGAIASLVTKLAALSGMKNVPSTPPEDAGVFPFGVVYETAGSLVAVSDGFGDQLVTIRAEIHISRVLLGAGITQAMAFRDPFLRAVQGDPTLGGSVSTTNDIRWQFGRLEWGGVQTIGYRFEVDVKVVLT